MRRAGSWRGLGGALVLVMSAGCFDAPLTAGADAAAIADRGVVADRGVGADTGVVRDTGTAADVPATDVPRAAPTVAVSSPASGADLPIGAPTQLTLAIANFTLVNFVGKTSNTAGSGHVHVYLDANDNNDYLLADYVPRPRVVIPAGTPVGPHTLRVSLRNHDHSALAPPVEVTVPFVAVTNIAPSVTITAPADNATVAAGAELTLMLSFINFTSRDFMGSMGITPGSGHFHVYLDGAMGSAYLIATHVPNPAVRIPAATTAGPHRLTVSLRNDDHSEIVDASADLIIAVTR